MSILTKAFIVVLFVLSNAFAVLTVAAVVRTTNWREIAVKNEEHAKVTDANLRHLEAANAARLATALDEVKAQRDKSSELQAQVQTARDEVARLDAQAAKLTSEKNSSEAMNHALVGQLQAAEAARTEYRKQRDELEGRNTELERQNFDLNDRVNELTAQVAVLMEQKRQYEQQVNILRAENAKLSQATGRAVEAAIQEAPEGAAMPDVTALSPVASRAIRGRVLEVSGNRMVISVGSADGVQKDMVFVIHREGQYVGDMKVDAVDPNQSAGRVIRTAAGATPSSSDEVTDALTLAGARGR